MGELTSLDLSTFLILADKIWIGGSYRTGLKIFNEKSLQKQISNLNSGVAAVQFSPLPNLNLGYAYDFSLGSFSGYSGGTHEISLGYFFNKKGKRIMFPFKCF